jgi:hypothetical protein
VPTDLRPLKEDFRHRQRVAGDSAELQEISRGIRPAILSKGGLVPALRTLPRRSEVPVELDVGVDRRFPESVELAAYYVDTEALKNTAKARRASRVDVCVKAEGAVLHLDSRRSIRDNGIGANRGNESGTYRRDSPRRVARRPQGGFESRRVGRPLFASPARSQLTNSLILRPAQRASRKVITASTRR